MSNQSETAPATTTDGQPELETKPKRKFRLLPRSPRARTALGVAVILLMVILSFWAPPEGETNNVTGDQAAVPTVSVTNLIETVSINRNVEVNNVRVTILQAQIAKKFSDDRKRAGAYTVRVQVHTRNNGDTIVGNDYISLVHLVLPDGTMITPKYVSVKPEELPHGFQAGYFDFPVSNPVPLSSLSLRFDSNTVVPF
ncbi:MAG: hypothetical protein JOZ18_16170 [Chloroflexi bacterium]|nr:hypothetical protein [Chloroflexota bacterium]